MLQHQFIKTNGIQLHYVTQGTGPLFLFLHGFPEFWYTWRHQIPVFAEQFTVVALDLRGYNDSDKPPNVSDYAMSELVKDISGVIAALGYERCILAGHDWGGAIAWSFAYTYPEQVEKLIILNCPHPQRFLDGFANPVQWVRSAYIGFFQIPWLPELLLQANDYQFISQAFDRMAVNRNAITETDIQTFKTAIARPGALQAALNYYRNLLSPSTFQQDWPVLEVPTLMIWGEDDPAFESSLAKKTEEYVRDFHLRYISQCGHWVPQEYPNLVNQYIGEFLQIPSRDD
ncbi:alpha/beta hydrolase [Oscillatoria sp. CS-180]|uniref:alpha/beta fold hydrolase n=1 Tax=Oscillatoria sp. CS-180 TaxID=3021720 RepID=UPI0023306206|nr:alpha/beta hydrolase [Oscillatoria sp. CS-180]MDB9525185.1 alpha/beta hydrolase [Oscillatoria sp. CS-180]